MAKPGRLPTPPTPPPPAPAPVAEEAKGPKPTPVPDRQWSCTMTAPEEGQLTIGSKFKLACEGDPVTWSREGGLWIVNREDHPFSLRLLKIEKLSDTKAELVVTSWSVGEITVPNPTLTDGKIRVGLGDQKFTVNTVIDPQENPEGKPFGPVAPMTLAWPIWLWLVVAAVAALFSLLLWVPVRRSIKRKKLATLLERNAIAMTPYNHFNKELRKLLKFVPLQEGATWHDGDARMFFRELENAFRWFLARELKASVIEGSPNKVVSEIKRADRDIWTTSKRDIQLVLNEMAKAQLGRTKPLDAFQIAELCRTLSDRIVKEKEA